jgi:CRISPR system Cascade subunit CasE
VYHSCLLIDTGLNPDRPRPGRRWLHNVYRVHQRVCMAFPSQVRLALDGAFLHPFQPDDFASGHVHAPRRADGGFLFRVDPLPLGRAMLLVQSSTRPDWDYAFHNARHLLAADPLEREYEPALEVGQKYRFRLCANAVRRVAPTEPGRDGPRVPVPSDRLVAWLERRAKGFALAEQPINTRTYAYFNKSGERGKGVRLHSVLYDGLLTVTDAAAMREAIISGIGPAKAFGFGLLSIAPLRD